MKITRRTMLKKTGQASIGIAAVAGLIACGREGGSELLEGDFVTMYDCNAMALYMDGTMGPKTGVIKVEHVIAGVPLEMVFWHGHGGKSHLFTVKPEHFAELKQFKKVTIESTVVDSHTHKLFIDFSDPRWRVPGALPVKVPKRLV